jgi:hypothetical protein
MPDMRGGLIVVGSQRGGSSSHTPPASENGPASTEECGDTRPASRVEQRESGCGFEPKVG